MENSHVYLKAMMSLVARQTFTPERLAEIVSPLANARAYEAYNRCDGTSTQGEVASALKLDSGNFSKMVKKWVDEGIMVKVTEEGKDKPVHVYPVADRFIQAAKKKGNAKKDG